MSTSSHCCCKIWNQQQDATCTGLSITWQSSSCVWNCLRKSVVVALFCAWMLFDIRGPCQRHSHKSGPLLGSKTRAWRYRKSQRFEELKQVEQEQSSGNAVYSFLRTKTHFLNQSWPPHPPGPHRVFQDKWTKTTKIHQQVHVYLHVRANVLDTQVSLHNQETFGVVFISPWWVQVHQSAGLLCCLVQEPNNKLNTASENHLDICPEWEFESSPADL